MKVGQIGSPETSVTTYHKTPRDIPEERRRIIILTNPLWNQSKISFRVLVHIFLVDCCPAIRQSTKKHDMYQLLYIYRIPPDDGLQTCPKHVEFD